MRVLVGARPDELPDNEPLALSAYRHFRLLLRVHQPGAGQLSGPLPIRTSKPSAAPTPMSSATSGCPKDGQPW